MKKTTIDLTFTKLLLVTAILSISAIWAMSQDVANGTASVSANGLSTTLTIQENEPGFCSVDGAKDNNNSRYTGEGFVNTDNASGKGITWSVNIAKSGNYNLKWRFANGGSSDRTAQIMVDGSAVVSTVNMPSTGSWNRWTETPSVSVSLSAGTKLIRLQATNSSGLANIDYVTISGESLSAAACGGLKSTKSHIDLTDNDAEKKINYYPNPVFDQLNIQFNRELNEAVEICLFDITGKTVKMAKASGSGHILDMSDVPTGLYTIQILGANLNSVGRIVKQ